MQPFPVLIAAQFLERPNRFRVLCALENGHRVAAFMPNPGRMWELLIPGARLFLVPAPVDETATRKTAFTVVGVVRHGETIFLHTLVTNQVAEHLLRQGRIAALANAKIVRSEVSVGHSRFDFLLEDDQGLIYAEVKSCTLFANGVAMFPDAITERGRRHLLALAKLVEAGHRAAVIFIVHSNRVKCFMPDYHTDPEFAATLCAVRDQVAVIPVSIHWTPSLRLGKNNTVLPIPWDRVARENVDRGPCIAIYHLPRKRRVSLHDTELVLNKGYFLVCTQVEEAMTRHLNRLKRKPKSATTLADWFRKEARLVESLPIRTADDLYPDLCAALMEQFIECRSGTQDWVFQHPANPLEEDCFHQLIEHFRMRMTD